MKKLLLSVLVALGLVLSAQSQTVSYAYQSPRTIFTAIGTSQTLRIIGFGAAFHQISWNDTGTVATCQIQVDSSVDGVTWGSGDIIASTLCTSNGTAISTSHVVNFVRINLTVISGAGAVVTALLTGYANSPGGGGTVTAVTGTPPVTSSGGNTPAIGCATCAIGPGTSVANHVAKFSGTDGVTLIDGGVAGTGTVTNTGGNLTANAVVLGAGTNDTKVVAGITTDGTSKINVATGGAFTINSDTGVSRTATAGHVAIGNGTGADVSGFLDATGVNLVPGSNNGMDFSFNHSGLADFGASAFIAWTGGTPSGTRDVGISRIAAGLLGVGTGLTVGSDTALLRFGNSCNIISDITLTVNTAVTVCQFSLPAISKAWSWICEIPWVISAGSGTNTISIGVNASQTPAATTTANAQIYSTNTGTNTAATVNLSASGALNVLTSPTITPAATVFQSRTFGTLSSNAAAGTFTITMTAAGTTATALAKAGASCRLF